MAGDDEPVSASDRSRERWPYIVLLQISTSGRMTSDEFEVLFLRMYKNDPTDWDRITFRLLDGLFAAVDACAPEPNGMTRLDAVDASQLLREANHALEELRPLT